MITKLELLQVAMYCAALFVLTKPLGAFMARVFEGERTFLSPVVGWLDAGCRGIRGQQPFRRDLGVR